jgi:hypothetical protein
MMKFFMCCDRELERSAQASARVHVRTHGVAQCEAMRTAIAWPRP